MLRLKMADNLTSDQPQIHSKNGYKLGGLNRVSKFMIQEFLYLLNIPPHFK